MAKMAQIVVRLEGMKREKGYLYYISKDKTGTECVMRSPMTHGGKKA